MQGMEMWLPVVGFEDLYEVSDHGRVRSIKSRKIKAQTINKLDGRPFMGLWRNNKLKIMKPHTMVLTAFVGPRPEGMEGCHNDGNPQHNHISNLRWDTSKNNHADKVLHGTTNRGERCGTSKLTLEQVRAIRSDPRKQKVLSEEYGVTQGTISRIKSGVRWTYDH